MSEVFLKIVNMSISAGWVVLAVLLLRILLKKAPKWITVLLWGIVGFRLICPFSIESMLSLIPSNETFPTNITQQAFPYINSGINFVDAKVNGYVSDHYYEGVTVPVDYSKIVITTLAIIWLVGMVTMLIYTLISYIRIKSKVKQAVLKNENVWLCDRISTPFIFGVIKPKIYLPFNLNEQDSDLVISHEKSHIKRKDHLWKPLGFIILSLHWFNPLMWLGYVLLCRDIEIACDEKVVKELTDERRADYSEALLSCSVNRRMIAACPLAFGEVGVKERVKTVLNYKKPAFWIVAVAIIAIIITSVCFLTNPKNRNGDSTEIDTDIKIETVGSDLSDVDISVVSLKRDNNGHIVLKIKWNNNSSNTIECGELFALTKPKSGECDIKDNRAWNLPAYPVLPLSTEDSQFRDMNREHEYDISNYYDVEEGETYRFMTDFVFENDKTKKYYVRVDFSIGDSATVSEVVSLPDPPSIALAHNSYRFKSDNDMATLSLSAADNTGSFSYSIFSSFMVYGTYEDEGSYIVLKGDNGESIYTFEKENDKLKFAASKSSELPSYVYSSGAKAEICVPDGAVFEKAEFDFDTTIDTIVFDIDRDGKDESCVLRYGPTSGLFTFTLSVSENGKQEYFNIYHSPEFYNLSFDLWDGKLKLKGMTQFAPPETEYFDFVIEGDNIVLSGDTQSMEYWGEQGLDSPYAP